MSEIQSFCDNHNQTEGQSVFFRPIEPHVTPVGSVSLPQQRPSLLAKRRSADVSLPPLPVLDPKRTKTSHLY